MTFPFENPNSLKKTMKELHEITPNQYNFPGLSFHKSLLDLILQKGLKANQNQANKYTALYYDGFLIGEMNRFRPDSTTTVAFNICNDKLSTEKHLNHFGINTTSSELFNQYEKQKAKDYVSDKPNEIFVIKPVNLSSAAGTTLNVTASSFEESWDYCIKAQKKQKNKKVIVQQMIRGFDLRVVIIEGRYSAATIRLPAHLVGDGYSSIHELIDTKNMYRKNNPYLKNKLIIKDRGLNSILDQRKLSLDSILEKDDVQILDPIANLMFGGESIDITNILSKKIINTALQAVASIPGLHTAGVDILSDDFKNHDGIVLEINTNANHNLNMFPYKGDKPNPLSDWIDSMIVKHKIKKQIKLTDEEVIINKLHNDFTIEKMNFYSEYFNNK